MQTLLLWLVKIGRWLVGAGSAAQQNVLAEHNERRQDFAAILEGMEKLMNRYGQELEAAHQRLDQATGRLDLANEKIDLLTDEVNELQKQLEICEQAREEISRRLQRLEQDR